MVKILFLGDIVGNLGRQIVKDQLSEIKKSNSIDFVVANGENATHGKGLSLAHYKELIGAGIDCITMGNHFYRVREIIDKNDEYISLIRPLNMHPSTPGKGSALFVIKDNIRIRVTNLIGRVFIDGGDSNPFDALNNLIEKEVKDEIHFVDFHAEATGEKMALALAFDGKISALAGTHTHVQTNDNRILPNGTGFVSDAGMCGAYDSILGDNPTSIISRSWYGQPTKFTPKDDGKKILNGVIYSINEKTKKCEKVELVNIFED